MKDGSWIILDELNLAKSEILEALNRLLDDNRELFLPELQIHLHPHKDFRLFATQNPSFYSGRKQLSRAFTNRFIKIHVDSINENDLTTIIRGRCPNLAPTFVKKMVLIMKDL